MTLDLDLLRFDPKINGFSGLIVKYFYVKFCDEISCGKPYSQTYAGKNPTPETALGLGIK